MVVNDTISDMLTRIRNANLVKHQIVEIPFTKMSKAIISILKQEGFVEDFEIFDNEILVCLKYSGKVRKPVISNIKRISRPGLRIYTNSKNLPKVLNNLGIAIVSTSHGVMTNLKAKELGLGGEILCYIW
uniref:Small ribosomal subunit protein uS8c n=1 Tax=Toxarium undulatum TaxID=210620 RepID=A0A1D8DB85_9STRA|nr:ribosomal protein S8 [Toxarium undulatum]AOS86659.1 ribosomal protein S8 [Toxarium undulatum]